VAADLSRTLLSCLVLVAFLAIVYGLKFIWSMLVEVNTDLARAVDHMQFEVDRMREAQATERKSPTHLSKAGQMMLMRRIYTFRKRARRMK